jgi:hypothetical protein
MILKKTKDKDRLYVFGGGLAGEIPVPDSNVYCLDLDSLFWVKLSAPNDICPSPRLGHSLTALDDNMYCFGGMDQKEMYGDMYKFNLGNFLFMTYTKLRKNGPKFCPKELKFQLLEVLILLQNMVKDI